MVQYIHIEPLIKCIVRTGYKNYKGPNKNINYEIKWDDNYQFEMCNGSIREHPYDNYNDGFLAKSYPKKDDPLVVYYDDKDFVKITNLEIYNISGWNPDPRARGGSLTGKEETPKTAKKKSWYANYSETYRIKKDYITIDDIAKGVFAVKSGKTDDNYELFTHAWCKITNNNRYSFNKPLEIELSIDLKFDHGS